MRVALEVAGIGLAATRELIEQIERLDAPVPQARDQTTGRREIRVQAPSRETGRIDAGLAGHRNNQQVYAAAGEFIAEAHDGRHRPAGVSSLHQVAQVGLVKEPAVQSRDRLVAAVAQRGEPEVLRPGPHRVGHHRSPLDLAFERAQVRGGRLFAEHFHEAGPRAPQQLGGGLAQRHGVDREQEKANQEVARGCRRPHFRIGNTGTG